MSIQTAAKADRDAKIAIGAVLILLVTGALCMVNGTHALKTTSTHSTTSR